jgi:hypothetical protein
MKHNVIYIITTLLTVATSITACSKKDVNPTLNVQVQEQNGNPASGATVRVWPGANNIGGPVDPAMDQTGTADAAGNVTFKFNASVVLNVDVVYYKNSNQIQSSIDTLTATKVVRLETVRQKDDDNTTTEVIEVF